MDNIEYNEEGIPYKVERKTINIFPLTDDSEIEAEEKKAISLLNIVKETASDDEDFEIVTNKDDTGRIVSFEVCQITKIPLQENKSIVLASDKTNESSLTDLIKALEQLKEYRSRLDSLGSDMDRKKALEELEKQIQLLNEMTKHFNVDSIDENLEEIKTGIDSIKTRLHGELESSTTNDFPQAAALLKEKIEEIEKQILEVRKTRDSLIQEYETIQSEEDKKGDNSLLLLSEEEQEELEESQLARLDTKSKQSFEIRRKIEAAKQKESQLKKEQELTREDLSIVEALNLDTEEYKEIKSAINRQKVKEAIQAKKGLTDIINKPEKERTDDEKQLLKEAKVEVFKEIHEHRMENENESVFDAIQVLYNLDIRLSKGKNPRVLKVSRNDLDNITEQISHHPTKIVGGSTNQTSYEPKPAPEDMENTQIGNNHESSNIDAVIVLFECEETKDYYIREFGLDNFNLISNGTPVKINDTVCYPIEKEDAQKIIEGQEKAENSYRVVTRKVSINQIENLQTQDTVQANVYLKSLLNYTKNNNISIYQYYLDIANKVREDPNYEPESFEKDNPFIGKEDYQNLINSKEEKINQYFAKVMQQVIEYNLNNLDKEDSIDSIDVYQDVEHDNDKYVSEETLSKLKLEPISGEFIVDGKTCYRVDSTEIDELIENGTSLNMHNFSFKQLDADNNENRGMEKLVLYQDREHDNDIYVRKYLLSRFQMNPRSEEVEIDGKHCFRISQEDVQYIMDNQNNSFSPYTVEIENVLIDQDKNNAISNEEKNTDNDNNENRGMEKFVLYRDREHNNDIYVRKYLLSRFQMNPTSEEVEIDGKHCFRISQEDVQYIMDNQNNSFSPYTIEIEDVLIDQDKNNAISNEEKGTDNDDNESKDTEKKQPTDDVSEPVDNNTTEKKQPIDDATSTDDNNDNDNGNENDSQLESEKPKGEIHYHTVIAKLTQNLDHLSVKGEKRFRIANLSVGEAASELRTGNWLYNVFGICPGIATMGILKLRQIAAKLLISPETREDYTELQRRLYEDLSTEELEVILRDYRGVNALADMNPQINLLIADRMRDYIHEKVDKLNIEINELYRELLTNLGEISALEERLNSPSLNQEQKEILNLQRQNLIHIAAIAAKSISKKRNDGIQLLSGNGLHSFEEDMKAVSTKMSYVGYRFAKTAKFDSETQALLAKYGQGFNDAIAEENDEAIIENFMNLEACYLDNTEIRNSIFGKRSVGTKYYTPLLKELDYRADPFIRNLLSTIAIASAAANAINSIYVHKAQEQLVREQNLEIDHANRVNDATAGAAQQVGKNIEGQRQTMMDGMESQIHHNVNEAALGLERKALDESAQRTGNGWSMDGVYNASDAANHAFYNQYHVDVTSQLENVASRYGAGAISEAQALQEMVDIANASQSTLNSVINNCLTVIREYASNHPNFDLTGIEESMSFISSHPDAIADMNSGILDIMDQASKLSTLSAEHVTHLSSLPNNLLASLISAASATTLALNVSSSMTSQSRKHKGQYGDDVVDMMENYLYGEEQEDNEEEHHHRR